MASDGEGKSEGAKEEEMERPNEEEAEAEAAACEAASEGGRKVADREEGGVAAVGVVERTGGGVVGDRDGCLSDGAVELRASWPLPCCDDDDEEAARCAEMER